MSKQPHNAEQERLEQSRTRQAHWKRWGPYLAERAWGTVREDYSADGTAWDFLPHDHARSKAYRWNEDGLAGICDRHQLICFSLALWNERDPILKERLFGLTGHEGNHGEDVKELYYYLDSTPTHSWMRHLYKYPQAEFPYSRLVEEAAARSRENGEFELLDTGIFEGARYFDVFTEYAKSAPDDIAIRIRAINRGPERAVLHLLPTVWFRNTWSWGRHPRRPRLEAVAPVGGASVIRLLNDYYGERFFLAEDAPLLFTDNETNGQRLYGLDNANPWVKDSINDFVIHGAADAINPARVGTKAAAHYRIVLAPGEEHVLRLRLTDRPPAPGMLGAEHDEICSHRAAEAEEFYAPLAPHEASPELRSVQRQAFAGLLWSKQFYHYDVNAWLDGDPGYPPPPAGRNKGRNHQWRHLYNSDVLSMPDTWEYPWYAAWDLAFHCLPLALVDSEFAKEQLVLLLREWYMHPNGQLPAYEWALGDVNPPVHAWAAWRVYKIDKKRSGHGDRRFLERVFHKLLLNFTWWVNRKDTEGHNVFQGGFLGLDNIGVFDRSAPLPTGGHIEQSDGTSWMGMYGLNMLAMALELAREDPSYEDIASKFFEHFVHICHAMNDLGGEGIELWEPEDGFYYDVLHTPHDGHFPLKARSMVGLIPLFAVESMDQEMLERFPGFRRRMEWFLKNRPELGRHVETRTLPDGRVRHLLSLVDRERLRSVLGYMLDEEEFLAPHGIRSLSRVHLDHPYALNVDGSVYQVRYEPAESRSGTFGGNSNWRGPVWYPVNYLIIESLQKFHHFLGDGWEVEHPSRSGRKASLWEVAGDLSRRLVRPFLRGPDGARPVHGAATPYRDDPAFRDLVLFYEYFHGDDGRGLGASHQTGWTGLVAKLIQQSGG